MKLIAKYLSTIFIVLVLFTPLHASDEKSDNDNNLKYFTNSLDLENKKFTPGEPENEFQKVMGKFMKKIMEQNTKTQKSIKLIGPIEFEAMSDLASVENIQILRDNLKQYKRVKKAH